VVFNFVRVYEPRNHREYHTNFGVRTWSSNTTTANEMNNFNPVAVSELDLRPVVPPHDFAVVLYRDALRSQIEFLD
jgi:hypothetical protein